MRLLLSVWNYQRGNETELDIDGLINDSEADTVTEHDQSYTTEDAVDEVRRDIYCSTDILAKSLRVFLICGLCIQHYNSFVNFCVFLPLEILQFSFIALI